MKLDRTTYEIYLIDYLDGKLDAVEVSELLLFLEQNPDLKEEFDGLGEISLAKETKPAFDASALKKPEYDAAGKNHETLLVAYMEGDLDASQQKELNRTFALYPELRKDAELFKQTRLQPDLAVTYKNKSVLKVFVIQSYYKTIVRVAAVLLLVSFAGIYFSNRETQKHTASNQPALSVEPGGRTFVEKSGTPDKNDTVLIAGAKPEAGPAKQINAVKKKDAYVPQQELIVQHQKSEIQLIQTIYKTEQAVVLGRMAAPVAIDFKSEKPVQLTAPQQEFVDVKTWLVRKFKKETNLENEDGLLAKFNKATHADLIIEKDTTGRLTRFEIAGIGLVNR